jgi:hypothetical protein
MSAIIVCDMIAEMSFGFMSLLSLPTSRPRGPNGVDQKEKGPAK